MAPLSPYIVLQCELNAIMRGGGFDGRRLH